MADLANLQYKVANGHKLTPAEEYFMMKSTDDRANVSRRKFTGIEEFPDSVIDFED